MIKANHKKIWLKFFNSYSAYYLKREFRRVDFQGVSGSVNKSILLIGNHFTWWDGFIQYYLNNLYYKKKFHVMMLEEQLMKNMILNKVGAFSVKKSSKELIESIRYSREILSDKDNMLLIFPQGEIQSIYTENYLFQSGVEHIINTCDCDIELIFNLNLIDYFSFKKPGLKVITQSHEFTKPINIKQIEQAYNLFAKHHKSLQKE